MTMDVSFATTANQTAAKLDNNSVAVEVEQLNNSKVEKESNQLTKAALPVEEQEKDLHDVANELTDMMSLMRKGLAFKVDEHSGQSIVSVMDINSGDVIRQIPNEEALELAQKLAEVAGFLLKTEA